MVKIFDKWCFAMKGEQVLDRWSWTGTSGETEKSTLEGFKGGKDSFRCWGICRETIFDLGLDECFVYLKERCSVCSVNFTRQLGQKNTKDCYRHLLRCWCPQVFHLNLYITYYYCWPKNMSRTSRVLKPDRIAQQSAQSVKCLHRLCRVLAQ